MNKKYIHLFIGIIIIAFSLYYAFKGVRLNSSSDFSIDEFKTQKKEVQKLCTAIKSEGYELEKINAPENTIDWLNEVLQFTYLYEKVSVNKANLILTEEVKKLKKQTEKNRKRIFKDLNNDEQKAIKRLNRLVIELAHPQETPESSGLVDALRSVRYVYILPAIFIVIVSYLLRALRWRYLVQSVKKDIKTTSLFSPLMIGFMANMLPARAGEFIRAYLLSKKEHISFSSSFATIFIERLFDLIMLLIMLVWVLLFMSDALSAASETYQVVILFWTFSYSLYQMVKIFGVFTISLCMVILLFSALLQFKNEWAMKIVGIFSQPFPLKWKEKIVGLVNSFTEGLNIIRDRRGFIATVFLSFLIWASFVLTYYPLYLALDIENKLPIVSSLIILCVTVAVFITLLPTPGFLGSYHLGCIAALYGIFGIQKAVALSYGIVAWLVGMGCTVIIGLIFAVKDHVSLSEFSAEKEQIK